MNDRFKFRVWITAPITRDVEEEKEVSFYIYDIALYDDGGIGFSRDNLLDALDKLNLTEGQRNEIEDYISDNSYSEDWEWYAISFDRIEQCTGLKDKNGKLIYEGDIVRESPYNKYFEYADYVVSWKDGAYTNEKCLGMKNKETGEIKDCSKGGYCFSKHIHQELADDFEVIGNIHENPELLEVG